MQIIIYFINLLRRVFFRLRRIYESIENKKNNGNIDPYKAQLYENYVQYFDQVANDYVRKSLLSGQPCMISKFGTIELTSLVNYLSIQQEKYTVIDIFNYIIGKRKYLWWNSSLKQLCSNTGFFPEDVALFNAFCKLYIEDIREVSILGSYIKEEVFFNKELAEAVRINIDGYYAPFFYNDPWTKVLKGKKVLVVHPFEQSIINQYSRRSMIWKNPDILTEFELITIKAVQTIAGEESEYRTWFEALDSMKKNISDTDFDIALIGCGAYGMPLAAHVKRMGKQAVHLAGWLQILFGIKGKRWIDNPRVASYMNDYWVHPLASEIPQEYKKIEQGCYW